MTVNIVHEDGNVKLTFPVNIPANEFACNKACKDAAYVIFIFIFVLRHVFVHLLIYFFRASFYRSLVTFGPIGAPSTAAPSTADLADPFLSIIGCSEAKRMIARTMGLHEAGQESNALFFVGPKKCGKKMFAEETAKKYKVSLKILERDNFDAYDRENINDTVSLCYFHSRSLCLSFQHIFRYLAGVSTG